MFNTKYVEHNTLLMPSFLFYYQWLFFKLYVLSEALLCLIECAKQHTFWNINSTEHEAICQSRRMFFLTMTQIL